MSRIIISATYKFLKKGENLTLKTNKKKNWGEKRVNLNLSNNLRQLSACCYIYKTHVIYIQPQTKNLQQVHKIKKKKYKYHTKENIKPQRKRKRE